MLQLTIALLVLSIVAQLAASWLALHQFNRIGRHYWGWASFSAMLSLMLMQHVVPLEWAINTGLYNFSSALIGFLVSLLALAAVFGLRRLLIDFESRNAKASGKKVSSQMASGPETPPSP